MSQLLPYETIVKASEGDPEAEIWTGWQHNRAAYSDDFTAATGRVGGFVL